MDSVTGAAIRADVVRMLEHPWKPVLSQLPNYFGNASRCPQLGRALIGGRGGHAILPLKSLEFSVSRRVDSSNGFVDAVAPVEAMDKGDR